MGGAPPARPGPSLTLGVTIVALALLLAACGRRPAVVRIAPKPQQPVEVNYTAFESPSLQFLPRK